MASPGLNLSLVKGYQLCQSSLWKSLLKGGGDDACLVLFSVVIKDVHGTLFDGKLYRFPEGKICRLRPGKEQMLTDTVDSDVGLDCVDLIVLIVIGPGRSAAFGVVGAIAMIFRRSVTVAGNCASLANPLTLGGCENSILPVPFSRDCGQRAKAQSKGKYL